MSEFISTTILLFIILDPIALALILPSLMKSVPEERRRKAIVREMFFALALLLLFFFLGNEIVGLLGLEQSTLSISGAIVLFLIALGMVFPSLAALTTSSPSPASKEPETEPFIVPIAIPMIVGPSSISFVMIKGARFAGESNSVSFIGSICAAWFLGLCIVLLSPYIIKKLGRRGSLAMERVIGILLILISVQMFMNGIDEYNQRNLPAGEKQESPQTLKTAGIPENSIAGTRSAELEMSRVVRAF